MPTDNTYVNAAVGAAVTVVLFVIPFAPVLGGAVAGYLERRGGGRVGTISGVFAVLPTLLLFVLFGGVLFGFLGFGDAFAGGAILLLVGLFTAAYTVALSAVGGIVGVYFAEEYRT